MARALSSFLRLILSKLEFIFRAYLIPSFSNSHLSIYETYPQSERPLLTQIAHLDWFSSEKEDPAHLLPDTLICRIFYEVRIVFRVVDYRTNYSACFSAYVDVKNIDLKPDVEVFFFFPKR